MKKIILLTIVIISSLVVNAQWKQTNGPFGGTINCIATTGSNIYVGTTAGLFQSNDMGSKWNMVNIGYAHPNVISLATEGSNIYLGTKDSLGVYVSNDNGKKWTKKLFRYVSTFAICDSMVLAGTFWNGIYLSTDHGDNWALISNGLPTKYNNVYTIEFKGKKIFTGSDSGVYFSDNYGSSWKARKVGLCKAVKTIVIRDTIIFAGTDGCGIFRSNDDGINWTAVNNGISGYIKALAIDDTNIIAGTNQGIYISGDDALNWAPSNHGVTLFPEILSLNVNGKNIFAGTHYGGLFLSSDHGLKWAPTNNVFSNLYVNSFATNGNEIFAGTRYAGIYSTKNEGASWKPVNEGLNYNKENFYGSVQTIVAKDSFIFAQTDWMGLYYSTNSGINWLKNSFTKDNVYSLAIDGSNLFACTATSIYFSQDFGNTWLKISDVSPIYSPIYSLFAINGNNIYAGSSTLYFSSDYGKFWTRINQLANKYFTSLLFNGSNIYAGTQKNGIFNSSDNGATWVKVNNGLLDTNVYRMARSGTKLFVGTYYRGVYCSNDYGKSWCPLNNGLTDTNIITLSVIGNNLYAGTGRGGVWKLPLSDTLGIIEPQINNTIVFYPNPANEMIYIELPEFNNTSVEIIDITEKVLQNYKLYWQFTRRFSKQTDSGQST